jgi:ABC-type branched-subunit amino acid transport system substrate-binding protein
MKFSRAAVAATVTVVVALGGLVATSAGAQSGTDPGVTAKTVKLGYIWVGSGSVAPSFKGADKAFQARIDRQNAQGGVNGRKIVTEVVDDQSSAANLTGAQDLARNRKVFAVINNSPFAFLSYRFLRDAGVPVIGGLTDGTYYGEKGNENVISSQGNTAPFNGLAYDSAYRVMKQLGATKTAGIGLSISPVSALNTEATQKYAAPALGLKAVYTNTAMGLGADPGPLVLGIKNSGADALYAPIDVAAEVAIIQGLQQNGVKMKANIMVAGYGQDILDSPTASTFGPETVFQSYYKPVELNDTATKQFKSDLKKYAGFTGAPVVGQYMGYISAELAILGLQHAGKTPTRQGFIDGIHQMGTYDQAGLACQPIDVSLTNFGKSPTTQCAYYTQIKNGKFVLYNKGKPIAGKLVGPPALLKANATGNAAPTTTTTAAP